MKYSMNKLTATFARRRASERANAGIRMYLIEWSFSICCQVKMKQVHTARKQLAEDPAGGKKPESYRQRLTTQQKTQQIEVHQESKQPKSLLENI